MEKPDTKFRNQRSREKLRKSHTIAMASQTITLASPHQTNNSAIPPATAASPVAFWFANAMPNPIRIGIHGVQDSTSAQTKRF